MSVSKQFNTGFVDLNASEVVSLRAAKTLKEMSELKAANVAEYQNFGTLLTPQFEREIADITRGRGVLGQILAATPAVGHPARYFEQSVLPNSGAFSDPRTLVTTNANNGGSLRVEKAAMVRALTGGIKFGLFDQLTQSQTSIFPQLVAKDLKDMLTNMYRVADVALWNGTAANLMDGASTQFCGLQTQITNTISVANGSDIVDAIRTKVAQMMANSAVVVKPSHIFLNPLLLDILEREIKNSANTSKMVAAGEVEVLPGVTVTAINTVAGKLPLVPAWEMPTKVNGTDATKTDYPIAILSMDLIENLYIGSPDAQMFKLGLVSDLADSYQAVIFQTGAIVKHPTLAHAFGYVTR